jgi:hypothetical protein
MKDKQTAALVIIVAILIGLLTYGIVLIVSDRDVRTEETERAKSNVFEVVLSDGTSCAVYASTYAGSIDCNWPDNPPQKGEEK